MYCTVPSQFGIPQPDIYIAWTIWGCYISTHISTGLSHTSAYWPQCTCLLAPAAPKIIWAKMDPRGFSSVNFHHLIPWARPPYAMVQHLLSKNICFLVIAMASTWVSWKRCLAPSFCSLLKWGFIPPHAMKTSIKQWNWKQRTKLETHVHYHAQIINVRWCFVDLACNAIYVVIPNSYVYLKQYKYSIDNFLCECRH